MEPVVSFDIPEKITIGIPQEFTITIKANDALGEQVFNKSGFSNVDAIEKLEYCVMKTYEGGFEEEWFEMPLDTGFGPDGVFNLENMEAKFRVTYKELGDSTIYYEIYTASYETEPELIISKTSDIKVVELGTDYMEIYEQFLSAVTDDRFAEMSQEELMVDLLPLLKRAIYYLCRIAKETEYRALPGYNLHDRDDVEYRFGEKLGDHEIECLAWAMVVSWLEQQINSSRLIEQQYYDAGIKTYSPNETMRNLITLHDDYYKKLRNRLTEYGYKTIDISCFGGNE